MPAPWKPSQAAAVNGRGKVRKPTVKLSPAQQTCVDCPADKSLLVKGIPGSGKTTVLVARAAHLMQLASKLKDPRVPRARIFTYNRTLMEYTRALAAQLGEDAPEVDYFHGWARAALQALGVTRDTINDATRRQLIKEAVDSTPLLGATPRLKKMDLGFWAEEFTWMKGRGLIKLEQYLKANRTGRGRNAAANKRERQFIFTVFEQYNQLLERRRAWDYEDLALAILREKDRLSQEFRAEHVLIDEGQDLQPAAILAIRASAYGSLTIAADKGQYIYPTRFRWEEIGIEINQTRLLKQSYRNTRAIADLARCLQRRDAAVADGDGDPTSALEYRDPGGALPRVIRVTNWRTLFLSTIQGLVNEFRGRDKEDVIAIVHPQWWVLERLARQLGEGCRLLNEHYRNFSSPGIVLTSMNSAKGLEFDYVIVLGVDEEYLPHPDATDDPDDPDCGVMMARRLLYVALTRARKELVIVNGPRPSTLMAELDPALYVRA